MNPQPAKILVIGNPSPHQSMLLEQFKAAGYEVTSASAADTLPQYRPFYEIIGLDELANIDINAWKRLQIAEDFGMGKQRMMDMMASLVATEHPVPIQADMNNKPWYRQHTRQRW